MEAGWNVGTTEAGWNVGMSQGVWQCGSTQGRDLERRAKHALDKARVFKDFLGLADKLELLDNLGVSAVQVGDDAGGGHAEARYLILERLEAHEAWRITEHMTEHNKLRQLLTQLVTCHIPEHNNLRTFDK
jgi:hypothetical protein